MTSENLIGKVVLWESGGQWFTAKIEGTGAMRSSWRGTVVDPGNYTGAGASHPYFEEAPLTTGQHLPNLLSDMITVVSDGH